MSCIKGNYVDSSHGYSTCYHKGKKVRQHRLAYCISNGLELSDIKGKVVRHTCDNRYCVNPKHLIIGTHKDNMRDMTDRNRQAVGTTVPSSVLTPEQVKFIRDNYIPHSPEFGLGALGKRFGCAKSTVHAVVKRLNWSHLES